MLWGRWTALWGENQSNIVEGVMFGSTSMGTSNPLQQENLTLPVSCQFLADSFAEENLRVSIFEGFAVMAGMIMKRDQLEDKSF